MLTAVFLSLFRLFFPPFFFAGVGFSFNSVEAGYDTDDTATAKLNLAALLAFYGAFPEYVM